MIVVCAVGDGSGRRGLCWPRAVERFGSSISLLSFSGVGVVRGEDVCVWWMYADVDVAEAAVEVKVRLPLCT